MEEDLEGADNGRTTVNSQLLSLIKLELTLLERKFGEWHNCDQDQDNQP